MVVCDGGCVDPETDPDFCGAADDCMGMNAGAVCPPSAECVDSGCVETCDNCSFEIGDFTDWTTVDLSTPLVPLAGDADGVVVPCDFFTAVTATDGTSVAIHGVDGSGATGTGSEISIGQDVDLRMGLSADLVFDYRVAWDLVTFVGMGVADRTFEVRTEPAACPSKRS